MSCWCGDGHFANEVQVLLLVVGQLEVDPCEVTVQECGQAPFNNCMLHYKVAAGNLELILVNVRV